MIPFNFYDPHSFLGLHTEGEKKIIRLWRPGSTDVSIELFGKPVKMKVKDQIGLFELEAPSHTTFKDYKVFYADGRLALDPYTFLPTFGELDTHLFNQGVHYKIYDVMGGRLATCEGVTGGKFSVWAPSAKQVFLVGDFNQWQGLMTPMRSMGASGVWEIFIPGLTEYESYKFEIHTREGAVLLKADPYAYFSELRPKNLSSGFFSHIDERESSRDLSISNGVILNNITPLEIDKSRVFDVVYMGKEPRTEVKTASKLFNVDRYVWGDEAWLKKRGETKSKMALYEVHLGSWKRGLNYKELAVELTAYCQDMGFTHVELMPIAEHPLDESWGYQVTGFYAVTSRFGTPEEFQYFVDYLHQHNLSVILDWVPGHFPVDDFSLSKFDGSHLYEHADPRKGFHPHWSTAIFNYGRKEVANFLIGNALFWFEKMHVDGLRVDAVASMLYLDYGRERGEWIPNAWGGNINLEAVEFLKHLNSVVHKYFPTVVMCAEESTSFPNVSTPVEWEGLGFDFKWNMGWMNDTLRYFSKDPIHRKFHQNDLTFGLVYAFTERFILVLSHDEVVHGKGSLISKMPGDDWQKFANVRLFYSYMLCQPGKKLLFMGAELGQWQEWNSQGELDWDLLKHTRHKQLQHCFKELNFFYQKHSSLWEKDYDPSCFEWIDFHDHDNSVLSYMRKSAQETLICVHNFTPTYHKNYTINTSLKGSVEEIFNTDREEFGGSGKINSKITKALTIELAPLSTMIFKVTHV